jgi:hypothetical protein
MPLKKEGHERISRSSDRHRPSWLNSSAESGLSVSGSRCARVDDIHQCRCAIGHELLPHGHHGCESTLHVLILAMAAQ